jgi:hypothetical protein
MNTVSDQHHDLLPTLTAVLPGPDRKRSAADYEYRLTWRNADPDAVGCLLLWHVFGGRSPYQIAIEREESGEMRSHCTCADAVYRADVPGHICKHVRGFFQLGKAG